MGSHIDAISQIWSYTKSHINAISQIWSYLIIHTDADAISQIWSYTEFHHPKCHDICTLSILRFNRLSSPQFFVKQHQ
ncbi:La-related 4B [Gossypium arboreum]|uniref:La-related 4B n=1 Tax=Gossypium arboreum TaxID=29729 RepID=A0A0B0N7A6_GOSAR|nr:La-related 4B [Gossypium arboreum]